MAEDVALVRDSLAERGAWMDRLLEQASLLWKPIEAEHLAEGEDISPEDSQ